MAGEGVERPIQGVRVERPAVFDDFSTGEPPSEEVLAAIRTFYERWKHLRSVEGS